MNCAIVIPLIIIFYTTVFHPIHCSWWDQDEGDSKIFHAKENAFIGNYPYVVSIVIVNEKFGSEDKFHCAGTVIAQRTNNGKTFGIVLTAGSCINQLNRGGFLQEQVRIRSNSEYWGYCSCGIAEEYEIHKWRLHPGYYEKGAKGHVEELISYSDIGIIATKGKWRGCYDTRSNLMIQRFSPAVAPSYTVLGWGIRIQNGNVASTLRVRKNVQELTIKDCKQRYHDRKEFPDHVICLAKSACMYDQGGPVIFTDSNGTYLAGIVSSTPNCAPGVIRFPPLVVRPNMYTDFIKNFTNINLNEPDSDKSSRLSDDWTSDFDDF